MLGYTALALLLVSLAQQDQKRLRQWGILSAVLFAVQYANDDVLLLTQCLIIAIHVRWLIHNSRGDGVRFRPIVKV